MSPTLKAARSNRVRHAKRNTPPFGGVFLLRTHACVFERSSHTGRLAAPCRNRFLDYAFVQNDSVAWSFAPAKLRAMPRRTRHGDVRARQTKYPIPLDGAFPLRTHACVFERSSHRRPLSRLPASLSISFLSKRSRSVAMPRRTRHGDVRARQKKYPTIRWGSKYL